MAPPKPDLKPIPRIKHPAFSSESSETEYTSASSDAEDNSNQRTPIRGVPVERYEVDKSGKRILVVDLGDSDDDNEAAAAPSKPQPLCLSCEKLKRLEPLKVVEKDVKIVVDLSAQIQALSSEANGKQAPLKACGKQAVEANTISLKANGRQVVAKVEAQTVCVEENGKQVDTETVFLRANGKQVEAKVKASSVSLKANGMGASTVSLKANGKQIEVDFRNEKVKPVANGKLAEGKTRTTRSLVHVKHTTPQGVKESIVKVRKTVLSTPEESEDEASTLSEDYRRGSLRVDRYLPDWSPGVVCDLCERGPSLYLGAWYSWCCGNPSRGCFCLTDEIQRRKKAMLGKGGKYRKLGDPPYSWSGKVHKLCGLWSGEVYEDDKHSWKIKKLSDAVRRSRKLRCSDPECGLFGATLGCRVSSCKRSFHYPCADRLAALVQVRMWDGMLKPVACKEHLHFADVTFDDMKLQRETKKESKKRKRGKSAAGTSKAAAAATAATAAAATAAAAAAGIIEIESSDDEERVATTRIVDNTDRGRNAAPAYFGKNLLCRDFSNGLEPIQVPCTNDVDNEEPPYLEYITKSRYKGQPLGSRNCPPLLMQRPAVACDGCVRHDPDDPMAPMSAHIPFQRREDDFREDWLNERMYGRLPYDKYARLVIGTDYNELVECNERCKCGNECINKEMQRGLRTPIELYKTVNKGWAVRTLVPIPRGKFVIEYVGEMLGQDKAQECGQIYDGLKRSYLYDLDYPESKRTPVFTLDGFHASNVARFINHSCDANLKIYRVFVETTYKWLSHIGMYAMRDIAPGEELSYDYNYGRHDLQTHEGKAEAKAEQQIDSTHIKCYCGAENCREWLWRPMHTGDDDSDEEI